MPTALEEPRAVRSAAILRKQAEDTQSKADQERSSPEHRRESFAQKVEELILDCSKLSMLWRGMVKDVNDDLSNGADVDLRTLGEMLAPTARRSLDAYRKVEALIALAEVECHRDLKDACDVTLAIVEIQSIDAWMKQWPTWSPEGRDLARSEII